MTGVIFLFLLLYNVIICERNFTVVKRANRRNITSTLNSALSILPAFFWLVLIFGFDEADMAINTLVAALLHESGHIGYLLIRKKVSPDFRGVLSGFRIKTSAILSYDEERAFYFAGPFVNLSVFVLASLLLVLFDDFWSGFAMINLVSGLSNLLPIEGYDGYGIVKVTLEKKNNGGSGLKVLSLVSTSLIFFLCIFSLYLINRHNGGYWIFFIFFFSMLKRFRKDLG